MLSKYYQISSGIECSPFREASTSAQADPARGGSRNCPQGRPQATASGMTCEKSSAPFVRGSKVCNVHECFTYTSC